MKKFYTGIFITLMVCFIYMQITNYVNAEVKAIVRDFSVYEMPTHNNVVSTENKQYIATVYKLIQ